MKVRKQVYELKPQELTQHDDYRHLRRQVLYEQTLNRNWAIFGIVRPAPEKKLPVILSLAEVRQILSRIRLPRYKVCLATIYSCGLRLQEGHASASRRHRQRPADDSCSPWQGR